MIEKIWIWLVLGFVLLSSFLVAAFLTTPVCFLAGPGTEYPSVGEAVRAAQPGCTVILLGGEYRENVVITKPIRLISRAQTTFVFFTQRSSGGSPFAVFAAPPKSVTFEAADPQKPAIEIRVEGVELRGLVIRGGSPGVLVTQTRHVQIIANRISHSARAGIFLMNTEESIVQGNEVSESEAGILLENSQKNQVAYNEIKENSKGLVLKNSHENEVRANHSFANQGEGFLVEASHRNRLTDNRSEGNSSGLVVLSSSGNQLSSNRLNGNTHSLTVWGEVPGHFLHEIDPSNTIDGKTVFYRVGERDVAIHASDQPAYVALINCERITVEGVTFQKGSEGILLVNTHGATLANNVLLGTVRGIYVWNSQAVEIVGNRLEQTEGNGITLINSSGNRLSKNRVLASGGHGVLLESSQENQLVENQMEGNRASGVHLTSSRKVMLAQNDIRRNWVGVFLEQGGTNVVQENWIRDSQFGIFIYQSNGNRLSDNRLENNRHDTNASDQTPPPPSPKPPPPPGQPSSGG